MPVCGWAVSTAALVVATGVAVLGVPTAVGISGRTGSGVIAVMAAGLAGLSMMAIRAGSRLLLRYGPLLVVYFVLVFGVTSWAWVYGPPVGSSSYISVATLPEALVVAAWGLYGGCLGYVSLRPARRWIWRSRFDSFLFPQVPFKFALPTVPALVYSAGLIARVYQVSTGSYGYVANVAAAVVRASPFSNVVSQVQEFTSYGLVLAAIDAFWVTRSLRSRVTLWVMVAIELGFALFSGVKGNVLFVLVLVMLPFLASGRHFPKWALLIGVGTLMVIIPVNQSYRSAVRPTGSTGAGVSAGQALGALPSALSKVYEHQSPATLIGNSATYLTGRLREIDNLAVIVGDTPSQVAYLGNGLAVRDFATQLIPRAVWPNKPVEAIGYQFSQQYFGTSATTYTSAALTIPGSLYRYGGLTTVLVGMLILGMGVAYLETLFWPTDVRRLLFYVPLVVQLIPSLEADVVGASIGVIESVIVLTVLSRIVFVRSAHQMAIPPLPMRPM